METGSKSRFATEVFTYLMRRMYPEFIFPGGGAARKCVDTCVKKLQERYMSLGTDRIVEFCICQVHAISRFGEDYMRRWRVSHSFGGKALERYTTQTDAHRYYQDRWLEEHNLSRQTLQAYFGSRSQHPLEKFIYPEYEEFTKRRLLGTAAGFYICQMSTLLWTPLSSACSECPFSDACRDMTSRRYHELYRLRIEYYNQRMNHGNQ